MAIVLREIAHSDFDQICKLFLEIYGNKPFLGFEKAFYQHNELLGYCLIDDKLKSDSMVGYFGCFTHNRAWQGVEFKYYNTHSWIVKPDYRSQSLRLLLPFVKLKDGIVTNFSANKTVARILEQLKFAKLGVTNSILKSSFGVKSFLLQRKLKSVSHNNEVLNHHQLFNCICLSLHGSFLKQKLDLVIKKVDRKPIWVKKINWLTKSLLNKPLITKNYNLHKVHYASDYSVLIDHLDVISHYLFLKKRVGGLIIPDTHCSGLKPERVVAKYEDEVYYKSNLVETPPIDYLFSEVFYLNVVDK